MKIGVTTFLTDDSAGAVELGRLVEELGFESLFLTEHTHIPAERRTPFPGGELPAHYWHAVDPFVALGAIAAVTSRLVLGTGIALVAQRDPIVMAKEVATLDGISGGRFILGVGGGWNREEMENHGVDPTTRFDRLHEHLAAMRAIWSEDEATFHGRFVDFDRIWSWPKPVQVPHPPVLIGGDGPGTLDRVLEDGDGWMPNYPRELAHLERRMADLAERAADRGRGRVPVTVFLAPADVDVLTALEALGVERSLLRLPPGPIERAEATLASYLPLLALDPTV